MKLQQGQVWKQGEEFLRIVTLERLAVAYKSQTNLTSQVGRHHKVTKKEFCRLIKHAVLLPESESSGKKLPLD